MGQERAITKALTKEESHLIDYLRAMRYGKLVVEIVNENSVRGIHVHAFEKNIRFDKDNVDEYKTPSI